MKKTVCFIFSSFIWYSLAAQMDDVLIGTRKTLQIQAVRVDVESNENRRIDYEYTPPKGWQIHSFNPIVIGKKGSVSYKFLTTRSVFKYRSTTSIYSKFIELLELASEKNVSAKYDSVIIKMRNDYENFFNKAIPTYSKIETIGSLSGNKKCDQRSKSHLYLDLQITLVYMPNTEEQFLQSLDNLRQVINSEE